MCLSYVGKLSLIKSIVMGYLNYYFFRFISGLRVYCLCWFNQFLISYGRGPSKVVNQLLWLGRNFVGHLLIGD